MIKEREKGRRRKEATNREPLMMYPIDSNSSILSEV
jgi:hypothetical protein